MPHLVRPVLRVMIPLTHVSRQFIGARTVSPCLPDQGMRGTDGAVRIYWAARLGGRGGPQAGGEGGDVLEIRSDPARDHGRRGIP